MSKHPTGHPWADFLFYRARALRWLRDEQKETTEQIARTMSMVPMQVRSILEHVDANPDEYAMPPNGTPQGDGNGE